MPSARSSRAISCSRNSRVAIVVNMTIDQARRPGLRRRQRYCHQKSREELYHTTGSVPCGPRDFKQKRPAEDWPSKRVHVILLSTFGALLGLLLVAGLLALDLLRQLETRGARDWPNRSRRARNR